jgi:uncharacterized protein (TIGR04255 family)
MPLNFPMVEDIHLANAPLREVICQVRFPCILRIAHEEPAEFQERIRARFPVLEVERGVVIEMEGIERGGRAGFSPPVYRFQNADESRTVSLAPDFYALSTTEYGHWADFADDLTYVAEAAQDVYAIPYATRIGLRYINVLDTTFTDSGEFDDVLDLLREELTVMIRTEVILSPELALQQTQVTTNGDRFKFRYGLIREGTPPEPKEPKFLLDFDHYAEGNLKLDDLLDRCDHYHKAIYDAFRWCIAEDKLSVFQPTR